MSAYLATLEDTIITSDQFSAVLAPAAQTVETFFHGLPMAVAKRVAARAIADQIYPWLEKAKDWLAKAVYDNWAKVHHVMLAIQLMSEHVGKLIIAWWDYLNH